MFNKFLKWYKDQQFSSSTASVAHTGTSFVGLTQSSSPGPCVVSFTNNSVCLQDRSSKQVIGTGYESHGLYHLRPLHTLVQLWSLPLLFMLS